MDGKTRLFKEETQICTTRSGKKYNLRLFVLNAWHNVPAWYNCISPLFWPGARLEASSLTFSRITTGAAYSRIGFTRDLYNKEISGALFGPSMLFIRPKTPLTSIDDDLVDMIAPRKVVGYGSDTEIFDIVHTLKNFAI